MKHQRITNKNWKNSATKYEACKDCLLDCEAGCPVNKEAHNSLAELEDKIENGTLVELPCKRGDKVYHIYNNGITSDKKQKYKIHEETVFGYEIDSDKLGWRIRLNGSTPTLSIIGDRVFFTRAEAERDYLNKEYNSGWEIEKVQPIIFTDNEKTHEEYLTEYATLRKSEIEEVRKKTAKELYNKAKGCVEIAYFESKISVKARDYINNLLLYAMKECGVDIDAE